MLTDKELSDLHEYLTTWAKYKNLSIAVRRTVEQSLRAVIELQAKRTDIERATDQQQEYALSETVLRFARLMQLQLNINRAKGHWSQLTLLENILHIGRQHGRLVDELLVHDRPWDVSLITRHCVNAANYFLMLWDNTVGKLAEQEWKEDSDDTTEK